MQFNHPKEKQPLKMWFFVEDMADYIKNNVAAEKIKQQNYKILGKNC